METLVEEFDGGAGILFDLDNDNDLDLIVANCSTHPNLVYFNDGGQFTLGQSLGSADSRAVAVADFDNDGFADLVFANADASNTVYRNNGDNTFTLHSTLQGNGGLAHSLGVASGDFDGDGLMDLVFANGDGANTVYHNISTDDLASNGNQVQGFTFGDAVQLGSSNSVGVALLHANDDTLTDIIFANSVTGTFSETPSNNIYLSDGNKGYTLGASLGSVSTFAVITADLDGDNANDILFVNSHGAHQIYLNDGSNNYSLKPEAILNTQAVKASVADLDNDGDNDFIFADRHSKIDSVVFNNGDGSAVVPIADLVLSVDDSILMITPGQQFSLSLTVTNQGEFTAQNNKLTVELPEGFELIEMNPAGGIDDGCTFANDSLGCTIGVIAAGATLTMTDLLVGTIVQTNGVESFDISLTTGTQQVDNQPRTATLSVTINAAPVANDDSSSLTTGNSVSVNVLSNDTDDGTLQAATVTVVDAPTNGTATANADGTITYTPNSGFVGSDSFTYTVMDDLNVVSNVATVAITVNAVVVPPPTPPASSGGGGSTGPWVLLGALMIWLSRQQKVIWFNRQRKGVMAK